jgi:CubicO group peptidase (beta-lactamase class C family)
MKIRTAARWLAMLSLATALSLGAEPKPEQKPRPAQSIAELKTQLEKILADTHTPGMSVAIVHRDGPEWVAGLGLADVATHQATTDQTLFRIGSTSKAFASLSILKLVREGRLRLDDPIRKLVPDLWFENKWEATNPVRVVDLLEHTTGWDDMHLAEYAVDARGWTLQQGLDYYKKSRVSRWQPGTRMSYCNSGPPVAAYIVEKITGQRFEDYVRQNFFLPIGMETATYFEAPSPQLTTLYHDDGRTPYPYWNILERPAGAINASARDMASYVQFYLNRGTIAGHEITPADDVARMEQPTRDWAAQAGLTAGYGLSNYTSIHDGFVYHGHNGGVEGGLTDMSYLHDAGVGYFYSINSGNGAAFNKIGDALRAYITRSLTRPAVPAPAALPANAADWAGWYVADSPRNEMTHFLERALGLTLIRFNGTQMLVYGLGNWGQPFVHVVNGQFRYLPKTSAPEPISTTVLIGPNSEGRFIQAGQTLRQIPALFAWTQILLTLWFVLAFAATLVYAPFWLIGGLFKSRRRPDERAIRLWPLYTAVSLIAFVVLFALSNADAIERLGRQTSWSAGLCVCTLAFALGAAGSLYSLWQARKLAIRPFVRWFSTFLALGYVIAALYFASWGVIGLRTWV